MIVNKDAAGKVNTQDIKILRMTIRFKAPIPRARPTPKTEPTKVCVADTGMPQLVATTTVVAAASVAAKARLGVRAVMELLLFQSLFVHTLKIP